MNVSLYCMGKWKVWVQAAVYVCLRSGVYRGNKRGLLLPHALLDYNHKGRHNLIIPRQRAYSAHMCSHKEPRELQGKALAKFAHRDKRDSGSSAPTRPQRQLGRPGRRGEGEGRRGVCVCEWRGCVVLTPLRLFLNWWELCSSLSVYAKMKT